MTWRACGLLGLVLGCTAADGADEKPLPLLYDVGDPCRTADRHCTDDATVVLRCVDDEWTLVSCEEVCGEQGPAYRADGCTNDCVCVLVDPDGCTPQESECVADDAVAVCSDAQAWASFECVEVCAEVGLESLGCLVDEDLESCWCTAEGTPCEDGAVPVCVDTVNLARCEAGVWVFEDCSESCAGEAACVAWASPPACECS
jgi:hypothetical protein